MMNATPLRTISPGAVHAFEMSLKNFELKNMEYGFPGSPTFGRDEGLANLRPGSKDGNKRKQSVAPGVWDMGIQDPYGFFDFQGDVSQDHVSKGNPPAKQQRLEQLPPSLPADSSADFLFGTSGCGETAEDKLDKIRAKNRQAQERFRAKKKAEEKAIQLHMNDMKNKIALSQQEVAMKKQLALSLGARGVAASTELAHVHSQLSQLSVSKLTTRRTSSTNSAPTRKSLPLTAWMLSKFGNPQSDQEIVDVFMPALESTCSPIFQSHSSVPRLCETFKYQERISLHHINTVPGSSALARTKHYKATVANRLGCSVSDICWRMDSVRVPELTGPDGMSTHFGTIECAPKLFLGFVCSLIEYSSSLLLLGRLTQDMEAFACEDSLDPTAFSANRLPYVVPAPQRTTSDCSDSTSTNTFHPRVDDTFASAMGLEPPKPDVPGPVEWSSPADCTEAQTTELLALSIFPKLLTFYISRMHPDDAATLCVQLSTLVQHFHAPAEDPKLDVFTSLVNSKIFAIMKSLDAAVQHAQLGLASKAKYKPLTKDGIMREISKIHRTIKDVTAEWHFILLVSQMDAGRQIRTMAMQICNPVSNGYVKHRFLQFEEQNVKAYAAIDMTFEQKQELAFVWEVFKQETATVSKSRESICQMLASLPSHKDLHVGDMKAMKATLAALQAKDKKAAATQASSAPLTSSADASTKLPLSELKREVEDVEGNCEWVQKLIGVSPEVTEVAENALTALHDMQKRQTELYSEFGEVYQNVLTPKQNAVWLTVLMPSLGDVFRVAEMATTDVRQQRMFNNSIGSLVHNPDEAATRARERALLYKAGLENPLPLPLAQ